MTYSTRVYIVERHSLTVVNSGMLEVSQALKESSEAALLQPPYNGMGQPNTPIRKAVIGFPLQRC